MKAASGNLIALLADTDQYVITETYAFTLADGTPLTYQQGDTPNQVNMPTPDPLGNYVVSFLDFHNTILLPPIGGSNTVTEDYCHVNWTIASYNNCAGTGIVGGAAILPEWTASQSINTRAVLFSDVSASFSAAGDFSMEFTQTVGSDDRGNYHGSSSVIIVCGLASNHATGPVDTGEWMLDYSADSGGSISLVVKTPTGLANASTVGYLYNLTAENEICLQRHSGLLSLMIGGNTICVQTGPPDNTPLFGQISFGTNGNGTAFGSNNIAYGAYSRWRYTVGVARYPTGSYIPTGQPFPNPFFARPGF